MNQPRTSNPLAARLRALGASQADLIRAARGGISESRISALCREIPTQAAVAGPPNPKADTRRFLNRALAVLAKSTGIACAPISDAEWDDVDAVQKAMRAPHDRRRRDVRAAASSAL